ncbi:MAG: hypothetical protein OHK0017_01010 [Patescibacteria group bacterium]
MPNIPTEAPSFIEINNGPNINLPYFWTFQREFLIKSINKTISELFRDSDFAVLTDQQLFIATTKEILLKYKSSISNRHEKNEIISKIKYGLKIEDYLQLPHNFCYEFQHLHTSESGIIDLEHLGRLMNISQMSGSSIFRFEKVISEEFAANAAKLSNTLELIINQIRSSGDFDKTFQSFIPELTNCHKFLLQSLNTLIYSNFKICRLMIHRSDEFISDFFNSFDRHLLQGMQTTRFVTGLDLNPLSDIELIEFIQRSQDLDYDSMYIDHINPYRALIKLMYLSTEASSMYNQNPYIYFPDAAYGEFGSFIALKPKQIIKSGKIVKLELEVYTNNSNQI